MIAVGVVAITFLHFVKLPAMLFGVGRYTVTMELPESGGLYGTGNVTYRGFEVGRVESVRLTDTGAGIGVVAVLSLKSGIDIPSDLKAEVHSQTAIGESYVELLPRNATSPPLKDGDVIPLADTSVPPDINDPAQRRKHRVWRRYRATTSRPSSTSPTPRWAGWGPNCPG